MQEEEIQIDTKKVKNFLDRLGKKDFIIIMLLLLLWFMFVFHNKEIDKCIQYYEELRATTNIINLTLF